MILVFGKTGQVAKELQALAPEAMFLGREDADLCNPEACSEAIRRIRPTVVINAAAYTAVDKAEEDEATALLVNGTSPTAMAAACTDLGIPFVHISTDYVFDGTGTSPWDTVAATAPLGAYGRTKLAGEDGVRASGATHAILRTSWVFSAHGSNFVKTMLRLSETHDALTIVADQIGGPTPARAIAEACLKIAETLQVDASLSGTYHFSGTPDVSWADFARVTFAQSGRSVAVTDIPTSAYPTPAKRPANSRLECSGLEAFGLARPDWRTFLTNTLKDLEVSK
jgi:dTDP-4-dehydrorhamnose reductase